MGVWSIKLPLSCQFEPNTHVHHSTSVLLCVCVPLGQYRIQIIIIFAPWEVSGAACFALSNLQYDNEQTESPAKQITSYEN